jgi:hypothetical protein
MKEPTTTPQRKIESIVNGTNPPLPVAEDRPRSRPTEEDLAAAIDRLVRYLENSERVQQPEQRVQHRTVVDTAMLRDWLAREAPGTTGENPGSKPVAQPQESPGRAPQAEVVNRQLAPRPTRPAETFRYGNVRTKVWANYTTPGQLSWSIQQLRVYQGPKGEMEARSFQPGDLLAAMRGAESARRWIKKHERRYRLLGWFFGA